MLSLQVTEPRTYVIRCRPTHDLYARCRLQQYAKYVEGLDASGLEDQPGCETCTANRLMLEKAWQTVANEFYDPTGSFNQAKWAESLLHTLQVTRETLLQMSAHPQIAQATLSAQCEWP